jgi:sec-independent protein translocase protein TatB
MFGIGWSEALVIGLLLLLVVPTEQLPGMARDLGKRYGQLRRTADELRRAFMLEADRMDASTRAAELKERRRKLDEERERRIAEAKARGQIAQTDGEAAVAPPVPVEAGDDPEAPAAPAPPPAGPPQ